MTNALLLPVQTWGTADLDHELASDKPFSPDWLRTETTGRQIGSYGLSLYAVAGSRNDIVNKLPDQARDRVEWGMRVVHEIQHPGPLDHFLTDFGHGTEKARVCQYWSETPVLTVSDEPVKWIALARPDSRDLLIVLASWSPEAIETDLTVDAANLGFDLAGKKLLDAETGETVSAEARSGKVKLAAPYGVRILRTAN
jgi:hypothetical protein